MKIVEKKYALKIVNICLICVPTSPRLLKGRNAVHLYLQPL